MRHLHIYENFSVGKKHFSLNVNVYLYKRGLEPIPDSNTIKHFISNRLIVGFNQGNTIDSYSYVTNFITTNEHVRLLKFLDDNPEVEFYYFIDEELRKLNYHIKNSVLKKNVLCFPRS
ncbi:MAG: hypothetical protein H7101_13480 [Deinococcales bacterium]|nr:hypothetical protein [Chitinophagaceae bacterium]